MKNTSGLSKKSEKLTPKKLADSLVESVFERGIELKNRFNSAKQSEPLKVWGGLALIVVLTGVAYTASQYMERRNIDSRSGASSDRVDVQVMSPTQSFEAGSEFAVPIQMHPNEKSVTGLELIITNSNPAAAEITDVQPNAPWARLVVKDVQIGQARLVFISDCSAETCTTINTTTVVATVIMRGSNAGGTTTVSVLGTSASIVGENQNMIGDLTDASVVVNPPAQEPSPEPSPEPSAAPGNDNTVPTVQITDPADGSTIPRASKITVAATADDNVGINRVVFSAYGKTACTVTAAPFTCDVSIQGKPGHNVALEARAYDDTGNFAFHSISVTTSK